MNKPYHEIWSSRPTNLLTSECVSGWDFHIMTQFHVLGELNGSIERLSGV
jgi:hypothetical protein